MESSFTRAGGLGVASESCCSFPSTFSAPADLTPESFPSFSLFDDTLLSFIISLVLSLCLSWDVLLALGTSAGSCEENSLPSLPHGRVKWQSVCELHTSSDRFLVPVLPSSPMETHTIQVPLLLARYIVDYNYLISPCPPSALVWHRLPQSTPEWSHLSPSTPG